MPLTVPYTFTSATVIEAAEMNSNFTATKNFVDGLATGTNLDSGSIVTAKIGSAAVTAAKLNADVSTSDQIVLAGQVFG